MNLHLEKISLFLGAGLLYVIGIYFSQPSMYDRCFQKSRQGICITSIHQGLGMTLETGALVLTLIGGILLLANKTGWRRWLKFSTFFVPIAILVVALYTPSPLFTSYLYTDRAVYDLGVYLYIPVTLLISILSYLPLRTSTLQKNP